jgi:hypothetical protein
VFAKIITLIFEGGFSLKGRAFTSGFAKRKIQLQWCTSKELGNIYLAPITLNLYKNLKFFSSIAI